MSDTPLPIEVFPEAQLGPALAARVARDLGSAIESRGKACLAVPGGATPGAFLHSLGRSDLPWDRVTVTLTDERCVPAGDARSNQRALTGTLFSGAAAAARFVPLFSDDPNAGTSMPEVAEAIRAVLPLDVCVLGMGEDTHTASLFPGANGLEQALAPDAPAPVMAMTAPGAPERRVTLTLPVLAGAASVYLLIRGGTKRSALERAMATLDPLAAPIHAVLECAARPVVFYAE